MRLAILALTFLLVGCVKAPVEQRSDDIFININADGPFQVNLPRFADAGFTAENWESTLRVSVGNATITWIDGPLPLQVTGSGAVSLEALSRQSLDCCAPEFIRGAWSHGEARPVETIPVEVTEGFLKTLSWHHEAASCRGGGCEQGAGPDNQVCTLLLDAGATGLGLGWHDVVVRTDDTYCTAAP